MMTRLAIAVALSSLLFAACVPQAPIPSPRSVIVYSGERIQTDGERMRDVEEWLQRQMDNIEFDESFYIRVDDHEDAIYPWDTFEIIGDTAVIGVQRAAADARTPHLFYAHYHLMAERNRLHEWLPDLEEGEELEPYEMERRILERVSDVWLLGRSVYDTHAYGPLDEILYATERGKLDEFILATQGDRFPEARERFTQENPGWEEELQAFFRTTFERDGPGYLDARAARVPDPSDPGS